MACRSALDGFKTGGAREDNNFDMQAVTATFMGSFLSAWTRSTAAGLRHFIRFLYRKTVLVLTVCSGRLMQALVHISELLLYMVIYPQHSTVSQHLCVYVPFPILSYKAIDLSCSALPVGCRFQNPAKPATLQMSSRCW